MKADKSKIVGVTFDNDAIDGGENRQTILKSFLKNNIHIISLDLIYTTYNGEKAIKVREKTTKQIVGWIPRSKVDDIMSKKIKHTVGFISTMIDKGEIIACLKIDKPKRPTNVEYHRMKKMCENRHIAMPAYDIRAYKDYEKKVIKKIG